ncbi:MAG: UDP-3-O-acyl-N-acetylglucosamine deacetylase [Rhizomicrobium sp.]
MVPARYDAVAEDQSGYRHCQGRRQDRRDRASDGGRRRAGIDDLLVTIDGPELPILDGDALSFFHLLERAGTKEQPAGSRRFKVTRPVEVAIKDAQVRLLPSDGPEYSYELDYSNTKAIGRQSYALRFTREAFAREIAPARTFGFMHELEALNKMGLGRGASLGKHPRHRRRHRGEQAPDAVSRRVRAP